MTERSAAEILLAQLNHEVAEAKADFARLDQPIADSLEVLIEKVCVRWWIGRMARREPEPQDAATRQARLDGRANMLHAAMRLIVERSGPISLDAVQINLLSTSAEIGALWNVLIECGIVTPAMRQDYLDEGVLQIFTKVEEHAQKLILAQAPMGRAQ